MHSIATVKSASGAAKYFAKDDFVSGEYYTDEKAGEVSMWGGEGAAAAGLEGKVSQDTFAKVLGGELPSGERVMDQRQSRRPGYDLTFSAPKSVSVMAYIAGDKRILGPDGAQTKAVQQTMAWIEKNLAETRITFATGVTILLFIVGSLLTVDGVLSFRTRIDRTWNVTRRGSVAMLIGVCKILSAAFGLGLVLVGIGL